MYNKPTKPRHNIDAVDIYDPRKIGHGNTSACNFSTAFQAYVSRCTGRASSAMKPLTRYARRLLTGCEFPCCRRAPATQGSSTASQLGCRGISSVYIAGT